jgi:hypothetical protein
MIWKKRQAEWDEERSELRESIKRLEVDRDKLLDQISDVGVKNYRRKQELAKERAEASRIAVENAAFYKAAQHSDEVVKNAEKLADDAVKIAEENAALRKIAEHNEGVERGNQVKLKALRDLLSDAPKDRDAAVLENQNLKRKREGSSSPPPSPFKLLTRPQGATQDRKTASSPVRAVSPSSKQPAPKKSRNRKDRWANIPSAIVNAPTTSSFQRGRL